MSKPLAQLREKAIDAVAQGNAVQGTLRIAAPYESGAHHLASVACSVMAQHPLLKVHTDVGHARVARITATFCAQEVADRKLVRLLPHWRCMPLRIYALLPGRKLVPAKVRVFLDSLEEEARAYEKQLPVP